MSEICLISCTTKAVSRKLKLHPLCEKCAAERQSSDVEKFTHFHPSPSHLCRSGSPPDEWNIPPSPSAVRGELQWPPRVRAAVCATCRRFGIFRLSLKLRLRDAYSRSFVQSDAPFSCDACIVLVARFAMPALS
jgi:hypothetical protein